MRELYKSFFKLTKLKTIQIFSFIVFIFLFSGITIGLISTPIQIINIANKINKQVKKWDYSWNTSWDIYDSEFLYKYFEEDNGQNNFLRTSLLNYDLNINGETLNAHMHNIFALSEAKYKNYEDFIGSFIRDNVFSFKYLYTHEVSIPTNDNSMILVKFQELVKDKWIEQSELNYGQIYRIINNDLCEFLNIKDVKIDSNFVYSYSWANYGEQRTNFNLEPLNLNQSNNVVLLKGDKSYLHKMKDNEILINDKYASLHHLKIGDYLKLNDFIDREGNPLSFERYKIVGFGTKISNLFATNVAKNIDYSSEVYVYLTDNEMLKYVKYLYKVDNSVILPNRKIETQNKIFLNTRISGSKDKIRNFSNALLEKKILKQNISLIPYEKESFSRILKIYVLQSSLFIVIGGLLLICSVFFINYCLKKELSLIEETIQILKASGYYSFEIASIFWLKVLMMLILGFTIGLFFSLPIQALVYQIIMLNSFVLVNKILLNFSFIFIIIFLMPLLLSLINFIYLNSYLKLPPLKRKKERINPNWNKGLMMRNIKRLKINNPFELAFIIRSNKRTNIVIAALSLSFIAFCFEINTKQFMTTLTDQWTPIYQNIDSAFNTDYKFDWKKEKTKKLDFLKSNEYQICFDYYQDPNDINKQIDLGLETDIERYLQSGSVSKLWDILNTDINKMTVRLLSIENLMAKIIENFKKGRLPGVDNKIIEEIERNWVSQFTKLNQRLIKKDIPISFNKMFIKTDTDFPIYKIDLTNNSYNFQNNINWKLILLDDYSRHAFRWDGVDETLIFNTKINEPNLFPVIVSGHFAWLNSLKNGDIFEANLNKYNNSSSVKMKIIGINAKDIYTNNIYGSNSLFVEHFTELNHNSGNKINLINEILTKGKTLIFNKNLNDFKINTNYFGFFIPIDGNKLSLLKVISEPQKTYDFITWNSFANKSYENYGLQRQVAEIRTQNFNNLMDIIGIATLLILSILYLVLILIAFLEEKNYLVALKAMGISNFILNLNLNLRIFLGVVLACCLGIIGNYFIWVVTVNLLFTKAKIIALSPFNWSVIFMGIIVILTIFSLGTTAIQIILKRMNIAQQYKN